MAAIETIVLPHLPNHPLYVALYKDVQNASFLRKQLLEGNSDFEYAFLDASVIFSRLHLLAACFRAINDLNNNRLKSRNVHSEVVFSLSPNNNIAESFRRFGIADNTRHIIAVKIRTNEQLTAENVAGHLGQNVEGRRVDMSDEELARFVDMPKLRKFYKFNAPPKKGAVNGAPDESTERKEMENFILGSMALKGS